MTSRLPKLIAFDLESLWDLWIDTHVTPPLKRDGNTLNRVLDRHGTEVALYKDVPQILHRLRAADVVLAAASRTSAPELCVHPPSIFRPSMRVLRSRRAREALTLLLVPPPPGADAPPTRAIDFFAQKEIYPEPGSKLAHFRKIHQKTGISYAEMLFFDDEARNREVARLGVTFHHVPHGVDAAAFEAGLAEWRRQHPVEVAEGDGEGEE
ncbi:hypothetical protein HWV62_35855 [Athelia sp. TMB]|nr:hypothetical protein HWV62_35855 [Athelia sp. TMB]